MLGDFDETRNNYIGKIMMLGIKNIENNMYLYNYINIIGNMKKLKKINVVRTKFHIRMENSTNRKIMR